MKIFDDSKANILLLKEDDFMKEKNRHLSKKFNDIAFLLHDKYNSKVPVYSISYEIDGKYFKVPATKDFYELYLYVLGEHNPAYIDSLIIDTMGLFTSFDLLNSGFMKNKKLLNFKAGLLLLIAKYKRNLEQGHEISIDGLSILSGVKEKDLKKRIELNNKNGQKSISNKNAINFLKELNLGFFKNLKAS